VAEDPPAGQGLKFAAAAADYDRGRPGWPPEAVEAAGAALGLTTESTVVDLGAGTGQLTRALAARFARVVAVEPLAPQRELLAAAALPGVEVREGTAEALPLPDASAGAVFVAEAFHWFDWSAALAEAARVLVPGGGIALLWNLPRGDFEPPLPAGARRLLHEAIAKGGAPGEVIRAAGAWKDAFAGSAFGEPRDRQFFHEQILDREGLIAQMRSISSVAGLPAAERDRLRDELLELLPDTTFRRPLRTEVWWARRSGD
jgi:SAM-dependent methyltransferase